MKILRITKRNNTITEQFLNKGCTQSEFNAIINEFAEMDVEYDSFIYQEYQDCGCIAAMSCTYRQGNDSILVRVQLWDEDTKLKLSTIGE